MKWALALFCLLTLMAAGAYFFAPGAAVTKTGKGFKSGLFEPPRAAPDFNLQGSNGSRLLLSEYRGKVVVLEFGFTFCQEVCPVTLAHLKEAHEKLGDAAKDVQVIFVTVDPKRDSAERLAQFLGAFNPTFLGATGTPEELQKMRDAYGIFAEEVVSRNKALGYEVNHSSFIYLIDRDARLRILVPFGKPVDDIVNDIKLLLEK
jgi:protein SCO1/2